MKYIQAKNNLDLRAQGTIEYLVIIGIVVVISFVIVSIFTSVSDNKSSVIEQVSKIEWASGEIALQEGLVDSDGNLALVIKNNGVRQVYLKSITIDGVEKDLNSTLVFSLDSKALLLVNNFGITVGESNSTSVEIVLKYITKDGLEKTISGKQKFFLNNVESVSENTFANQSPVIFGETDDSGEGDDGSGEEVVFSEPLFDIFLLGDDGVTYVNSKINFSFFVENYEAIKNCSLIIDGEIVSTKTSGEFEFSSTNTFDHNFFENSTYSWDINCVDTNDLVISSENGSFDLTIDRNFSRIETCLDLQSMSEDLDGNYILMNDIYCAFDTNNPNGALYNDGLGFSPIGNSTTKFNGTFDGAGYTISGLNVNRPDTRRVGLFGQTSSTSLIANLKIVDSNIIGLSSIGGLVGYSEGQISKCSFEGTVRGMQSTSTYTGGLVGYIVSGKISGSYSKGNLYGGQYSGGLIGYITSSTVHVSDSFSQMNVSATNNYTGGLISYCTKAYVARTYSSGSVSSSNTYALGGLVGYSPGECYVTNSFWDTESSGSGTSSRGTGKTTAEMKTLSTFAGFDFDNIWSFSENEYIELRDYSVYFGVPTAVSFAGGDGSIENPYQISTCGELQRISDVSRDANFVLIDDVDCSDTMYWIMGRGFVELGSSSSPFNGSFNGNGFTISNLVINRPIFSNMGLFGYTSENSLITNVNLVDASVSGSTYVGGLVGYSNGEISNVSFDGLVYGRNSDVGGIIGYSNGDISIVSFDGLVCGGNDYIGGFIGYWNEGNISLSSSIGNVFGDQYVGGFIGFTSGVASSISNSFSQADILATNNNIGGFIGYHNEKELTNVYSSGSVSSSNPNFLGGLVGYSPSFFNSEITNSFWDAESSGRSTSYGGTGKTTNEMQQEQTFTNWDFVDLWMINEGSNYPRLRALSN